MLILKKIKDIKQALFYINKTIENSWSRSVLEYQIETNLYGRQGKAVTNFSLTLPAPQKQGQLLQRNLFFVFQYETHENTKHTKFCIINQKTEMYTILKYSFATSNTAPDVTKVAFDIFSIAQIILTRSHPNKLHIMKKNAFFNMKAQFFIGLSLVFLLFLGIITLPILTGWFCVYVIFLLGFC